MNTKTLLIVGGTALAAFLAYKYITAKAAAAHKQPGTTPTNIGTQGNQQGAPGTTGNGILDTATSILQSGSTLYQDLFGGNNTSGNG